MNVTPSAYGPVMACRAFNYLIQPTVRQAAGFEALLEAQRELYNAALEERRGAWQWERRTVTRYQQYRTLTGLRAVRPDVLHWGVTVCRGTLARLDEAFQAFYRRCAQGQRPGLVPCRRAVGFGAVARRQGLALRSQ